MPATFDPDQYTTAPTRSPGATLSLARSIISAASPRPVASLALRLAKIRERAQLLQTAWIDAGRSVPSADLRQLDNVLDRRWAALRGRLDSCALLGDDELAPRAEALSETLFPTGLDFLKLAYPEEWAQSERRLVMIATDELEEEIEALAGEPYLPLLREAHTAYGDALGITKAKDATPDAARVLEPLKELRDAIASYARGVVGTMNEDDPKSVRAAQQQLDPILRARRPQAAGEGSSEEPSEPIDAPLPELPVTAAAVAEPAVS